MRKTQAASAAGDHSKPCGSSYPTPQKKGQKRMRKAFSYFVRFQRAGRMAFALYLTFILLLAVGYTAEPGFWNPILLLLSFAGFLGLLVYTSMAYSGFFEVLGRERAADHPLMLLFMGMPLYILIYLRQEQHMKDAFSGIQEDLPARGTPRFNAA